MGKRYLKGIYTRGNTQKHIEIHKKNTKLSAKIDGEDIAPFTPPIIALAYWYISYMNENKQFASVDTNENHKTLDPFDKLQLIYDYDAQHNKINITLYHSDHQIYCNESHFFIHSMHQLIQHFDSHTQAILQTLCQRYDESFLYSETWFKLDPFISELVIRLVYHNELKTSQKYAIVLSKSTANLKIICKITNNQILTSFFGYLMIFQPIFLS